MRLVVWFGGAIVVAGLSWGCANFESLASLSIIENYSASEHGWHKASGESKENPVEADERSLEDGQERFRKLCVPCHGPAGDGKGSQAASLAKPPADLTKISDQYTDYHLFLQIRMGRGGMPMWRSHMDDNEIWDVVNYVRHGLAKSPPKIQK